MSDRKDGVPLASLESNGWRSGLVNVSIFDDPIVEEVIDSLRREISMLEQRLVKTEE